MLVKNAVELLSRHGTVTSDGAAYRAVVGRGVITFHEHNGQVARLRCQETGHGAWSPRSLSAAVRSALARGKPLSVTLGPMSGLLVSVGLGPRGRSFESVASFIVMDMTGGPNHLKGANDDWNDPEATQTAVAAIEGRFSGADLVNWLVARGGGIAEFAATSQWPSASDLRPGD